MPPTMPQQGNQEQEGLGMVWIVAGVFVLLFGVWYFARAEIVAAFFFLKNIEINILQFFTSGLGDVKFYINHMPAKHVSFGDLSKVANQVGSYLRYPAAVIIAVLGMLLYFRGSAIKFNQTYTMKTLLQKEVENWPQSIPVLSKELVDVDCDQGPWAMALKPMEFAKKYKLLAEPEKYQEMMQLEASAKYRVSIKLDRANQVFAMQLGKPWRGIEYLTPPRRALLTAFIARGMKQTETSNRLLDQISRSTASGKLDFSGTETILKKFLNEKEVQAVINRHAYELTVMASVLQFARTDGVLSSAEFLWLKPIDRSLWFMLNSMGRQTAVPEAAGPFAHWIIENKLKRALRTPTVEEATKALDVSVREVLYQLD